MNFPATTMTALALGLALHGTAVAQDHQGHAAPTPVPVAQDHAHHPAPAAKKVKKKEAEQVPASAPVDHSSHAAPKKASAAKQVPSAPPKAKSEPAPPVDHSGMNHGGDASGKGTDPAAMGRDAMDHGSMDHGAHHEAPAAPDKASKHPATDHGAMDHGAMDHGAMDHSAMGHGTPAASSEPLTPIPAVTDADRAAAFPVLQRHMEHAPEINSYVAINRLEAWEAKPGSAQAWEAQAWVGSDLNRLWLRSEGERSGGKTEAADLEVLYGRSVSTWWDVLAGIKHDFSPGGSQTWAAFGVQGFAPYKFDVKATAYVGESGQTAANVEAEYELLLTNRLILQPLIEVTAFAKNDPARGIGSGLSSAEAGVRLRFEISRKFAPYVGVVHERAFGNTADFRRADGDSTRDTRLVAGVRIWF
ncbi:MAG: copper resistance protein B [Lysobacter sp.]